ncbi:MAG: hypothetical protein M3Y72_04170 [Acidobacteriota bacterium]|nr:hypothetical protein [Acidobacteriota bacterium]
MIEQAKDTRKSVRRLLILIAIMLVGYACIEMFRFGASLGNLIFVCAYLIVPFFAIQPVRRLSQPFKALGYLLLTPVLVLSVMNLSVSILDALVPNLNRIAPLQTIQQGRSSVQIGRYEHGGAVGVRGVYLEQRRPLLPGLYLVRSVDAFAYAHEATLSEDGPYRVKVHAIGSYEDTHSAVDRIYSLKPWVYF